MFSDVLDSYIEHFRPDVAQEAPCLFLFYVLRCKDSDIRYSIVDPTDNDYEPQFDVDRFS